MSYSVLVVAQQNVNLKFSPLFASPARFARMIHPDNSESSRAASNPSIPRHTPFCLFRGCFTRFLSFLCPSEYMYPPVLPPIRCPIKT